MATPGPTIFRPEALDYRLRNRGRRSTTARLPGLMTRPALVVLWIALAVGIIAGAGALFGTVPRGISAIAVPGDQPGIVAVIVPSGNGDAVRTGQVTTVTVGATDLPGRIVAVEPGLVDAATLATRVALPVTMQATMAGEFTLAWVELEPGSGPVGAAVGWAMIETGERRVGSYLPLIGGWFGE